MFRTPESRTLLRALLAATIALLSFLTGVLLDGSLSAVDIVGSLLAAVSAFGAWYGVGAKSPTEPFLGAPYKGAEVPADANVKEV